MAARGAIRDVGRALAIPYAQVDVIAKLVPMELNMTITKALEISSELKKRYSDDETTVSNPISYSNGRFFLAVNTNAGRLATHISAVAHSVLVYGSAPILASPPISL